jgi:8-oxo-dGTP pyrophosphatase MutT (NUDIX family)
VLLLHGWDPYHPDAPFWFTIGGAADPGETLPEAGARELLEEVGIAVDPALLGEPIAVAAIVFTWAGMLFDQDQTFFAFPMDDVEVSFAGQEALERATIDKYGWLLPEELEAGGERPADPDLPRMMRLAAAAVRSSTPTQATRTSSNGPTRPDRSRTSGSP